MKFSANYEVKSEASVMLDGEVLRIQHPKGLFKARIKNIVRKDRSAPFILSMQVTFEAPSIEESQDVANGCLLDCMNMLCFVTGSAFTRHRTRLIAEAKSGMGHLLVWANDAGHEDPQPLLEPSLMRSVERLLQFDAPAAVRRALRWYRMGVNAEQPEDQFQYFWFALEILAEYQKPAERVPDKCPECQSPLYCETCKKHPTHRMYIKPAIYALIKAVDKECKDETIEILEEARNRLMHGATLKEIAGKLPEPSEHIVDVLGKILFNGLLHQFPRDFFKERIYMAVPTTYVHRHLTSIFHMETVIPTDESGELSMAGLTGTTVEMVSDRPGPQSALPFVIEMTPDQLKWLRALAREKGDHRELCDRVYKKVQEGDGKAFALVYATDMASIQEAVKRGETGAWQDLFREIITANPPKLYRPRQ